MNSIKDKYLREVESGMEYSKRTKKYFLKELCPLIDEYIAEHPEATVEDLYGEFGRPNDYKNTLADNEVYAAMLKKAEKKSRLFLILCIVLGIIAVLAIAFIIYLIREYGGTTEVSNIHVHEA